MGGTTEGAGREQADQSREPRCKFPREAIELSFECTQEHPECVEQTGFLSKVAWGCQARRFGLCGGRTVEGESSRDRVNGSPDRGGSHSLIGVIDTPRPLCYFSARPQKGAYCFYSRCPKLLIPMSERPVRPGRSLTRKGLVIRGHPR